MTAEWSLGQVDDVSGKYETPGSTAPHRAVPLNATTQPPPRCFGLGLNLDTHRQPGSHWVCVFIDCRELPYQIIYYDSAGRMPTKRTRDYMNRVLYDIAPLAQQEQQRTGFVYGNGSVPPVTLKYNNVVHQLQNNECGMYVLTTLERLSRGKEPFDHIRFERRRDDALNSRRKEIFVPLE